MSDESTPSSTQASYYPYSAVTSKAEAEDVVALVPRNVVAQAAQEGWSVWEIDDPVPVPTEKLLLRVTTEATPEGAQQTREVLGIVAHVTPRDPEWVERVSLIEGARRTPSAGATGDLVGSADIAKRLGVKSATIATWHRRYRDFPAPATTINGHPVWNWTAVEAWVSSRRKYERSPSPQGAEAVPPK